MPSVRALKSSRIHERTCGALRWRVVVGRAGAKNSLYPRLPGRALSCADREGCDGREARTTSPTCLSSRRAGALRAAVGRPATSQRLSGAGGHRGGNDEPDAAISDDPRERDFGSGTPDMAVGRDAAEAPSDLASDLSVASSDPFDPASCMGPAMSPTEALARIGTAPHIKLADATLMRAPVAALARPRIPAVRMARRWFTSNSSSPTRAASPPTTRSSRSRRISSCFRSPGSPRCRSVTSRTIATTPLAIPAVCCSPSAVIPPRTPIPSSTSGTSRRPRIAGDDLQGLLGTKAQLHIGGSCARLRVEDGPGTEIAALYRF